MLETIIISIIAGLIASGLTAFFFEVFLSPNIVRKGEKDHCECENDVCNCSTRYYQVIYSNEFSKEWMNKFISKKSIWECKAKISIFDTSFNIVGQYNGRWACQPKPVISSSGTEIFDYGRYLEGIKTKYDQNREEIKEQTMSELDALDKELDNL